ncbi:hypothetical protein BVC80_1211g130 [Macleaya cordata]|uniref:Uncharacterized protein n=1 Tax=Macleaya cordata TaxID=56857 RepID=A0A200Q3M1_MACCD|nr:hypothetical protein BVC80_1211g130 [Macleaya cordata]
MDFHARQWQNSGNQENQNTWHNDPEISSLSMVIRNIIREKLFSVPQIRDLDQHSMSNLIGFIERSLLMDAASKEEYMNKETLDQRLEMLIQRVNSIPNSSSSIRVMPTPGMPKSSSNSDAPVPFHHNSITSGIGNSMLVVDNTNQFAGFPNLRPSSASIGSLPNEYKQGFPIASFSCRGNKTLPPRSISQLAGNMSAPYNGFVSSKVEAVTASQQSNGQVDFIGRSIVEATTEPNEPIVGRSSGLGNNLDGYLLDSQSHMKNYAWPPLSSSSIPLMDSSYSTLEQVLQSPQMMHKFCQFQQQPLQSCMHFEQPSGSQLSQDLGRQEHVIESDSKKKLQFLKQSKLFKSQGTHQQPMQHNVSLFKPLVQDETQWTHHRSEGSYRFQTNASKSLPFIPYSNGNAGCFGNTDRESGCTYCRHFPYLFEFFKNRTCPSFREKHPELCLKLDQLTRHLRNCQDRSCGCEKYRLIYQHFVDCYRFAYMQSLKRFSASQNCDSSSLKSKGGIQRTRNDGDASLPTNLKIRKMEHPSPPHSSSMNESCRVSTSIDQPHFEEGLPQMLGQLPMPLSDKTKVMESNEELSADPTHGDASVTEVQNGKSEDSHQVIHDIHVPLVDRIEEK